MPLKSCIENEGFILVQVLFHMRKSVCPHPLVLRKNIDSFVGFPEKIIISISFGIIFIALIDKNSLPDARNRHK